MQAALHLFGLAIALSVAPLAPQPRRSSQQTPGRTGAPSAGPIEITPRRTAAGDKARESLLGVWELVEADWSSTRFSGANCRGYLTVLPEHCTLIVRLEDPVTNLPNTVDLGLSAGAYRWTYDDAKLSMVFSTLLAGTDMDDPDGVVRYEPVGARREYSAVVGERDLVLTRGQGERRLFFRRLSKGIPGAPKPDAKSPPTSPPTPPTGAPDKGAR
ncbi:MAG: hypothetical protein FJ298_03335 [Planctomycetes bacterium]|nr:hypothetical protein [Planctomycetota bacterium]